MLNSLPIFVLSLAQLASCYHVLFHHNLGRHSHLMQMKPLMEELLERGHQVTSMFFQSVDLAHDNYTELLLPADLGDLMWEVNKVLDGKQMIEKGGHASGQGNKVINNVMDPTRWYTDYLMMDSMLDKAGRASVEPEQVNKFLKSKTTVDAVVTIFPHMAATVAEIFDCPIILFSPSGPLFHLNWDLGRMSNPSLMPLLTSPFAEPMTFKERIQNHLLFFTSVPMVNWIGDRVAEQQKEILDISLPPQLETIRKRSSIMLSSSHPVTHGSWQYPANVIEVGGMQLKEASPLPEDLKTFVGHAKNGVVLVSLGASLTPEMMPPAKLQILLDTFSQLDMQIIWKWTSEVPDLPPNVLVKPWLPQQDLLAHTNIKLFLSHGGLGSLTESLYHRTPMVAIPLSNDQKQNMFRARRQGYTTFVNWDTLSVGELVDSIQTTLVDQDMRNNLEKVRSQYLDREEEPKAKAAWWVEYVCRHGQSDLLRVELKDIGYVQLHHLDILLFLGVLVCVGGVSFLFLAKKLFRSHGISKTKSE